MEIVSNLGVNCIIGWRFMLLLGAGTEPSLARGSYASITNYEACIPDTGSTEISEMPQICIMSSAEKTVRLGRLYSSKDCESIWNEIKFAFAHFKNRNKATSQGTHRRTQN